MPSNNLLTEETVKNFSQYPVNWGILKGYALQWTEVHKKHKMVGRHQKAGTGVLCETDQFAVYSEVLSHAWRSVCSV